MLRANILAGVVAAGMVTGTAVHADIPVFSAQCPSGITVSSDGTGNVSVNGTPARVQMFNEHYYEARAGGITFPISTEDDGSGLLVGFDPRGSRGGFCTIMSTGPSSAAMDTASGPDFFRINVNSRLKVHSGPSVNSPTIAKLPRGMVVENLGCRSAEGRTWCHIADGDASGWAAAEFLVEASGPIRAPRATPIVPSGTAATTTQRVQFSRGSTGTFFGDSLLPQEAHRYVLGAQSGQFMSFQVIANGPGMTYKILNPDGSLLLGDTGAAQSYRGQLWQSGDHVIEVRNTANGQQSFDVLFEITAGQPAPSQPIASGLGALENFVGARAGQAEMGLQNLGFQLSRTQGLTAYWFNQGTNTCAAIVTSEGRYTSINMVPAGDC